MKRRNWIMKEERDRLYISGGGPQNRGLGIPVALWELGVLPSVISGLSAYMLYHKEIVS